MKTKKHIFTRLAALVLAAFRAVTLWTADSYAWDEWDQPESTGNSKFDAFISDPEFTLENDGEATVDLPGEYYFSVDDVGAGQSIDSDVVKVYEAEPLVITVTLAPLERNPSLAKPEPGPCFRFASLETQAVKLLSRERYFFSI